MNKQKMETYYQAFNTGNHKALADFYTDDVIFEFRDIRIEGKEAVMNHFAKLQHVVSEKIDLVNILSEGNRLAVEVEDTFTAKINIPDFLGQPLNQGESITGQYSGFYTTRDNRICRVRLYRL